jgi:hypothetical protein
VLDEMGTAPVSPWKVLAAMFAGFWLILALLFLLYLFD